MVGHAGVNGGAATRFVLLRLYGPLEPWFGKHRKSSDFELLRQ